MRKSLLLLAAAATAFGASAATETCFIQADLWNLGDSPVLEAGTKLAESDNLTFTYYHEDTASSQNPAFNGFKQVIVNGEYIDIVTGIGGNTNGAAVNLLEEYSGSGCMYGFQPKVDGYVIVVSKISSNKPFYVFEGELGQAALPISYTLGMDLKSDVYPDITQIIYTIPSTDDGYLDLGADDIEDYTFGGTGLQWPIRIATGNVEAESGGNGTGVIVFKAYAEAGNYVVFATGSKMNTCGAIFVPGDDQPSVSLYCAQSDDRDETTIDVIGSNDASIAAIIADNAAVDAPLYNIYGQRVNADYKGLVISNGVKYINK